MFKKTIKYKKSFLLSLMGASSILLCCCSNGPSVENKTSGSNRLGRVVVLVEDFGEENSLNKFSAHLQQVAKESKSFKDFVVAHIETIRNEEDYLKELANMRNRAENLNRYVLEEIDKQKWDRQKDEFVLVGFKEGGVTVVESAETLRKEINLTKVISISAPLNGYDFHNIDYGLSQGAIGQLIVGMSQATLGSDSTVLEELTPGSDYLKKRHDFIQSQTGAKDLRFYFAAASLRKLCLGESPSTEKIKKLNQEVKQLFDSVAKDIRDKYKKTSISKNPNDLPGVPEYMRLRKFWENSGREGFYTYYKLLNDGKDHDGVISVDTQLANQLTNPRIRKVIFDSYSGTLFIPYKELKDLKQLELFTKEEYIYNSPQLYNALSRFILE
jgi:hypothetical protein